MLRTTTLGKYWQDNSGDGGGSSFTRVRTISTARQAAPQVYGHTYSKTRAFSDPDARCIKKFMRFKKKTSLALDPPCMLIERKSLVGEETEQSYTNSLSDLEFDETLRGNNNGRLLVCTLDTEENERNLEEDGCTSLERNRSRNGSVEMVTARNMVSSPGPTRFCRSCGNCLEHTDMVVVLDEEAFHMGCFHCGQCGQQVNPAVNFLMLEDGSPLCEDCSPLCHSCGERIVSTHINVLNKDFHEACLKCSICEKTFGAITKVYATGGEPCCAECVTPVFSEAWSARGSMKHPTSHLPPCEEEEEKGAESKAPPVCAGVSAGGNFTLPPRLESLSKAVHELPDARFHTLLRPSISVPSSLSDSPNSTRRAHKMSLSSLKAVMYDELGVSLLMNFCMEESIIEFVVFWLDTEHFRHFDGNDDDMKLFAHHIMLKYIGYYAELPVNLPKETEDRIVGGMQEPCVSQDIFSEAQEWVLNKMEKEIQPKFLRSSDGQKYLEALVNRDITRRKKKRELKSQTLGSLNATVTSFDKRQFTTKYYVYEIEVEEGEKKFMIYRRYSEFYSLQQALKCSFPNVKFLAIPKKIYFGRSQTRSVARQRRKDLESYLQGIFSLPVEVSQSDVMRQFLAQTCSDKEDESFNSRISSSSLPSLP